MYEVVSSMATETSSIAPSEPMEPAGYIAAAVVLFFIGFFGFFLNLFVIVLMCKDKQLWTPLNVILFNLVCSDFSVSILGNPFTLASSIARHWIFGRVMCVVYGFFMSLLGITSITTLTVLAFERYLMVTQPLYAQHLSRKLAIVVVVFIWIYSALLTAPPFFGWGSYVSEAANISCSVNWESRTYSSTTYIMFLFLFGLVVPLALIIFSYMNIIKTMRQQQQNTLRMGRVKRAERRVTCMVATMIIAFLIAWTPYAALALLIQFGDATIVTPGLAVVPALMAKSSICYNPLIYVGLNTQFRASWKHLFKIGNKSDVSIGAQAEYTKNRSRFVSNCTQDSVDDKHKFNAMLLTSNQNINRDATSQHYANSAPKKKSSDFFVQKARRLSTVIKEKDVIETKLVHNDTQIELVKIDIKQSGGDNEYL